MAEEELIVKVSQAFGIGWKAVCSEDNHTEWADLRHQAKKALNPHIRAKHPGRKVRYV